MKLEDLKCIDENIDIEAYIDFREDVKSKMEHPEWLGNFTKEEIEDLLKDGSKIWVYYDGDIPVCSMFFIPATEKSVNKFNIDKDYKLVGDYGPMFVNFDYLGNGFQLQMLKVEDKYCLDNGYKYASSTIHPDNIFSINNFIKDDFEQIGFREFSRGPRNIYFKEL